ncbi:hypothetical protein [Hyphomonas sp.]|uniref:hypothetical protein n=1 Tax=Hyphomonas sp. TaxID=87 RepID=UPI0025C482E1|nr:hypothetical protein [Hyphomonas sp.]
MKFLARTPVIWISFVAMLVIGAGFGLCRPVVGGAFLDMTSDPDTARTIIAAMTGAQRTAHAWVTVLLDTAYPLAYGGFLGGLALRFFGRFGPYAALPALGVVIVDLTENLVQVLALADWADALDAKAWLTPLKFGLFFLAAGIAILALGIGLVNLIRKRAA